MRDLIVREPASVRPEQTLGEFMDEVVWSPRHTTYPVVADGQAVGLLPFRRVATVPRRQWDARLVRETIVPRDEVPLFAEDDDLVEALGALGESELGRGLVVDGDRLLGLLSITDVARALEVGPPRRALSRR